MVKGIVFNDANIAEFANLEPEAYQCPLHFGFFLQMKNLT